MGAPRTNRKSQFNPKKAAALNRYHQTRDEIRAAFPIDAIGHERYNRLLNNRQLFARAERLTLTAYFQTPDPSKQGQPYRLKPDFDNLQKTVADALVKKDETIYASSFIKLWGDSDCFEILLEGLED